MAVEAHLKSYWLKHASSKLQATPLLPLSCGEGVALRPLREEGRSAGRRGELRSQQCGQEIGVIEEDDQTSECIGVNGSQVSHCWTRYLHIQEVGRPSRTQVLNWDMDYWCEHMALTMYIHEKRYKNKHCSICECVCLFL